MFFGSRPSRTARSTHAIAAAPAPEQTSFTSAMFLPTSSQTVEHRRGGDDRGAVLVVVKDRNLHALAQLLLDDEALGRLDVFQIDAAEGRLEPRDGFDQFVGIVLGQLDVEHVDVGEFLEQAALAFHHRLAGQRSDVAETEHRRAVGDDPTRLLRDVSSSA